MAAASRLPGTDKWDGCGHRCSIIINLGAAIRYLRPGATGLPARACSRSTRMFLSPSILN